MSKIFSDDILTIHRLEDGADHYLFKAPKGISEKNLIQTFLTYFIYELEYYSRDACIDLITMAYELCKDKLTKADERYLGGLRNRKTSYLKEIIWNKILGCSGEPRPGI